MSFIIINRHFLSRVIRRTSSHAEVRLQIRQTSVLEAVGSCLNIVRIVTRERKTLSGFGCLPVEGALLVAHENHFQPLFNEATPAK